MYFADSPDISTDYVLCGGIRTTLEGLDKLLSRRFDRRYESHGLTDHAVRFSLTSDSKQGSIDVDLLPSPYWMNAAELHCFLGQLRDDNQRRKWVSMATATTCCHGNLLHGRIHFL